MGQNTTVAGQPRNGRRGLRATVLAGGLLAASQARALDYQFDDVQVSLNTIVSGGFLERTGSPDKTFTATTNGGRYEAAASTAAP